MPPAFLELSAVLVLATALGIIAKLLKQPLIIAYILSGIIISMMGLFKNVDKSIFDLLSNLGIAFLLFLVGIELKFEDLKFVGKAAIWTGIGQIIFTAIIGFVLVSALGYSPVSSFYIAIALTFASTVIIIKLLSEKNELQSLYGKISVGFLLVQDFVAMLFLMFLSTPGAGGLSMVSFGWVIIRGVFLVAIAYLVAKYVLRYVFRLTSSSVELLFVTAISWAFALSAVAAVLGFSTAIGAFLAGLAIASSSYRIQISARVKPIRDFFIIIFFILLGASISFGGSGVKVMDVLLLSIFVLIGRPLIVLAIMLTLKFRNKTAFLSGVTVTQVSEFSLILMTVSFSKGLVSQQMVSLVSAVAIVTITLSSYLILYGDEIWRLLDKPFSKIFPQTPREPYVSNKDILKDHIILVGGEQMGWDILQFLKTKVEDKEKIVVIDFNPQIIQTLRASGFNAVYGDISDPDVLEELQLGKAKVIIMTDLNVNDSSHLMKTAKSQNFKGPIIAASYWIHDAIKLYETGADYVVVPETVGGKHVARLLGDSWGDLTAIKKAKTKHFEELLAKKIF